MNKDDIEEDSLFVKLMINDDGSMRVASGFNLTDKFPEEDRGRYIAIIYGILAMLEVEPDAFIRAAAYANHGIEMAELEREQDLQEALSDRDLSNISVIDFKGKIN